MKYRILDSDIQSNLNRYYGYDHEIIRAAEDEGFHNIEETDDGTITGIDAEGNPRAKQAEPVQPLNENQVQPRNETENQPAAVQH